MATGQHPAEIFAQQRYLVAKSVIPQPLLSVAYVYALKMAQSGNMHTNDPQVPDTPSMYGDPLMESMLDVLTPDLERALNLKLFQTYAYFRVYKTGDILKKHKDRPACEISLTATLGYESDSIWPIYVEYGGKTSEVLLQPGDALIYRGCECDHWREPFKGRHQAQVFLHYVDQNGPYAEHRYDQVNLREHGETVEGGRRVGDYELSNQG